MVERALLQREGEEVKENSNGNNNGPTWRLIAIAVCGMLIGVGSWTINDLYNKDKENKQLILQVQKDILTEMSALKNCIIGRDRYAQDMADLKDEIKVLTKMHLKNGASIKEEKIRR